MSAKRKATSHDHDAFGEIKTKKKKTEEETNVSRSGRIRKKSSLLADFQSSDDLGSTRYKKKSEMPLGTEEEKILTFLNMSKPKPQKASKVRMEARRGYLKPKEEDDLYTESESDEEDTEGESTCLEQQRESGSNQQPYLHASVIALESFHNFSQESNLEGDDEETDDAEEGPVEDESVGHLQSVIPPKIKYKGKTAPPSDDEESEEEEEELEVKKTSPPRGRGRGNRGRGRGTAAPVIRKPKKKKEVKEKSGRCSAYNLWAREARKTIMKNHPGIDFIGLNKRLSMEWAVVPRAQKAALKRKARLFKDSQVAGGGLESVDSMPPSSKATTYLNKPTSHIEIASSPSKLDAHRPVASSISAGSGVDDWSNLTSGGFKVVGTQPLDVAAHLTLLGESLSVIGQRLKEQEGQISVSGGLPVLLDSLLCAMGPLICLTQLVPSMAGCPQTTLSRLLDNIAYIMPGM